MKKIFLLTAVAMMTAHNVQAQTDMKKIFRRALPFGITSSWCIVAAMICGTNAFASCTSDSEGKTTQQQLRDKYLTR